MTDHDQAEYDHEVAAWLRRQDPPLGADRVARQVIAQLSPSPRTTLRSFLTMAATAAMVVAVALVGGQILSGLRGPIAPTPRPPGTDLSRLPVGTVTIDSPGYSGDMVGSEDAIWFQAGSRFWTRIDPASNTVQETIGPGWDATLDADGRLWVLSQPTLSMRAAPLVEIDPRSGARLRTIEGVSGVHLAIDGTTAWVTDGATLFHVDLAAGVVTSSTSISVGPVAAIVAYDGAVYLGGDGGVVRIDASRNGDSVTLATVQGEPLYVSDLAVGAGSIWAQVRTSGAVLRLKPDDLAIQATIGIGTTNLVYGRIVFSGGWLWSAAPGGIVKIVPATNTIGQTIRLPWGKYPGIVERDGELWVSLQDEMQVLRFPVSGG